MAIALFLAFRLVLVGADLVLCGGDRIVWQTLIVDAAAVRVADLFVRRPVAFNGALVAVGIVLLFLLCVEIGGTLGVMILVAFYFVVSDG